MGGVRSRLFPQYPDAVSDLGKVVRRDAVAEQFTGIRKDSGVPRRYDAVHGPGRIDLGQKKCTKSINVRGKSLYLSLPQNVEAWGNLPDNVRSSVSISHVDQRARAQSTSRGALATIGLDTKEQVLGLGARLERAVSEHVGEGTGSLKLEFCFPVARFNLKDELLQGTHATLISEVFVGVKISAIVRVSGEPEHHSLAQDISAKIGISHETGIAAKAAGKSGTCLQRGRTVEEIDIDARGVNSQWHTLQGHSLDEVSKDLMQQAFKSVQQPQSWQVLLVDVVNDDLSLPVAKEDVDDLLQACKLTKYKDWFVREQYHNRADLRNIRREDLTSTAGMTHSEASRLLKELDPNRADRNSKMTRLFKILSGQISQESLDIIEDMELTQAILEKMAVDDLISKGLGPKDARAVKELINKTATANAKSSVPRLSEVRLAEAALAHGRSANKFDAASAQPDAPLVLTADLKKMQQVPEQNQTATAYLTACSTASTIDECPNRLLTDFCQVERATIQQKLGKGTSGVVFKLLFPSGQARAVKTLCTDNGSKAEKAVNEARALQKVRHPNIVKFYESRSCLTDIGKSEILLFMELCEGGTLQQELDQRRDRASHLDKQASLFSHAEVAQVASQLIRALAYCVEMGLVHGDVKPQNVLIDRREHGQDMLVKLCDFSEVNLGTGTPLYMSPQRLAVYLNKPSRKTFSKEKADVFSLGLTILAIYAPGCCLQGLNENRDELSRQRRQICEPKDDVLSWLRNALQQMLQWREEVRANFPKLEMLLVGGTSRCAPRLGAEGGLCDVGADPDTSEALGKCPRELPAESEVCNACNRGLPLTKDNWGSEALSSFIHRRYYPCQHENPSPKDCLACRAKRAPPDDYCASCGELLRYKGSDKNASAAQKKRQRGERRCQVCAASPTTASSQAACIKTTLVHEGPKLDHQSKQLAHKDLSSICADKRDQIHSDGKQLSPEKVPHPPEIHINALQSPAVRDTPRTFADSNLGEAEVTRQLLRCKITHKMANGSGIEANSGGNFSQATEKCPQVTLRNHRDVHMHPCTHDHVIEGVPGNYSGAALPTSQNKSEMPASLDNTTLGLTSHGENYACSADRSSQKFQLHRDGPSHLVGSRNACSRLDSVVPKGNIEHYGGQESSQTC